MLFHPLVAIRPIFTLSPELLHAVLVSLQYQRQQHRKTILSILQQACLNQRTKLLFHRYEYARSRQGPPCVAQATHARAPTILLYLPPSVRFPSFPTSSSLDPPQIHSHSLLHPKPSPVSLHSKPGSPLSQTLDWHHRWQTIFLPSWASSQ
jgi:hypothetical protein